MENLFETIQQRTSTRNYSTEAIDLNTKSQLLNFIAHQTYSLTENNLDVRLVEMSYGNNNSMRIDYGLVRNHHSYLLAKSENNALARVNYGFVLEQAVLKATELGLASCWIGYFDPEFFSNLVLAENERIPSIVIIGYPNNKFSLAGKLLQMSVKANKRKAWHDLFYYGQNIVALDKLHAGKYIDALEMLRLAPSSGNTQPWRVVVDSRFDRVHFYKNPVSDRYNRQGLHDVDMGIALSHFYLTLKKQEIKGRWSNIITHIDIPDDWQYLMSWIGEE